MNQRQGQQGPQVFQVPGAKRFPIQSFQVSRYQGTVDITEYRTVEFMVANSHEIDIVRQAGGEVVPMRGWGDFNKRNTLAENPLPQHGDVSFQRGDMCILYGLSLPQQIIHFVEQVIPDEKNVTAVSIESNTHNLFPFVVQERIGRISKGCYWSIYGDRDTFPFHHPSIPQGMDLQSELTMDGSIFRSEDNDQLSSGDRKGRIRRDHDIVCRAFRVWLPWGLEKLEELLHRFFLFCSRFDADHSKYEL
ncbi:MAG: hypothetical protein A2Z13_05465 [Deltaproteobacteria bacterium RBG_16_64_85]|nr:MAG: hypothetical protein A2Z13_05465 [Deltaproteobacteria bacterium RBG_16_64_85]